MAKSFHATRKTTSRSSFPVYRVGLPIPVRQLRRQLRHRIVRPREVQYTEHHSRDEAQHGDIRRVISKKEMSTILTRRNLCHDLLARQGEFPDHRSDGESIAASSEAPGPSEPRHPDPLPINASGSHNAFTHFPEDRHCEVCRRTKTTRAPCNKRSGSHIRPRGTFW